MTSYYYRSGRHERYLSYYRSLPKEHFVYLIHIPDDAVGKLGRTCRLPYRLRNLSAALYKPYSLYLIRCTDGAESLKLERHMRSTLKHRHVKGEWHQTTPQEVESLLIEDFRHLSLEPDEEKKHTRFPPMMMNTSPLNTKPVDFTVTMD